MELGLSKHNRHVELCSVFGQFQLSKVHVHQDLAAYLTYNPSASGLHWLLPKLRMHIKLVEALALPTRLCEKEAFFLGGPSSFYIGVISLTPMMTQLDLDQLERPALEELPLTAYARQLWGKEPEKPIKIPELELALLPQTSLQRKELAKMEAESLKKIELERTALHMSFTSLLQTSLRTEELTAERACHAMAQCFTTKPDEGRRASALYCAALLYHSAIQLQLLGKELVMHLAFPEREKKLSLPRVSGGASGALPAAAFSNSSSTKPKKRTSRSLSSTLLSIFLILMVSIFPSNNLDTSFNNNSFIHCCAFQLVEQDELSTNFGQKELGKKNEFKTTCWEEESEKTFELQILLWEPELEELLVAKRFQLDQLQDFSQEQQQKQDQLSENNVWKTQLQQTLLENDEQKELENQELEKKNFDKTFEKMIFQKKLDALVLEWHFAKAASHQLYGIKAWEKYREASKEISFDKKKGDKELPPQLRRQELDCKDLRSASFRALCPNSFKENSFTAETFAKSSLTKSSLTASSLTKSSLTEHSFLENSFLKNSFSENSFDKSTFTEDTFHEETFHEESFTDSSLTEETFSNTSLGEETFSESSFEKNSFADSSLTEETFEEETFDKSSLKESSFQTSSFAKSSLERSSFNKSSFAAHSFTACSFNKSSFEESSFDTSSLAKQSFSESSLEESSLQPNSFEDSFEASSFQEGSLDKASFQRTALTPELAQLQRRTSTTELAELERRTLTLELAELDSTALHTELEQLDGTALERAASSLELHTAHSQASFSTLLGGPLLFYKWGPRGSAKGRSLPLPA